MADLPLTVYRCGDFADYFATVLPESHAAVYGFSDGRADGRRGEDALGEKKLRFVQALDALRALLLAGRFTPGQRLSESALAERLGLSRTPLREAMAELVTEGLLERADNGGIRVRKLTIDDIFDGIELRGTVEGLALRRAAERGVAPTDVARARCLIAAQERVAFQPDALVDLDSAAELNEEFHALFGVMSGSAAIARELDRISRLPYAAPSALMTRAVPLADLCPLLRQSVAQHRAMIDAVELREGARAEALAREHALLPRGDRAVLREQDMAGLADVPGLAMMNARRDNPLRNAVSNGRTS